ncbi:HAMP domain-containing sensor histidine kinase [Glycomyces arizonensis]|uniref:HAMP domain-containing sensor histidine kinase n=1 Tax=Glycomyces arizonensis TaxID=256035 RepID=UPI00146FA385|nr:HAMP domain-containing sensor histidine kinase [Glycomyces arizonensis]
MRSLRARLTFAGALAIYLPVLLVFVITSVTESEITELDPNGESYAVTDSSMAPSGWAVLTVVALGPVAVALAWWWSGRAVRPLERIRSAAEHIEASDLSLRIGLASGPSETVALAASFDAMLDRLEHAAGVQRRLIEETSHELRTPLSVLITNAEVLLQHPSPDLDLYREGLERTRSSAGRLRETISELLTDARGRARRIDRRPVDLVALARAVLGDFAAPAAAGSVELAGPGGGPVECAADEATVRRAIANLVDNAVKHAPEGSAVEVGVERSREAVAVTVTDHGPGIPEVERERVFERFWHGEDAPGTGLGLPIARQIAQAHGGDLTVEVPGPAGDGCRFRLSLPAPRLDES